MLGTYAIDRGHGAEAQEDGLANVLHEIGTRLVHHQLQESLA